MHISRSFSICLIFFELQTIQFHINLMNFLRIFCLFIAQPWITITIVLFEIMTMALMIIKKSFCSAIPFSCSSHFTQFFFEHLDNFHSIFCIFFINFRFPSYPFLINEEINIIRFLFPMYIFSYFSFLYYVFIDFINDITIKSLINVLPPLSSVVECNWNSNLLRRTYCSFCISIRLSFHQNFSLANNATII